MPINLALNCCISLFSGYSYYIFQSSDSDYDYYYAGGCYYYSAYILCFYNFFWAQILSLRFYFFDSFLPEYLVGSYQESYQEDSTYTFSQAFTYGTTCLLPYWFNFCFSFLFYFLPILSPMPFSLSTSIAPNNEITSTSLSLSLLYLSAFSFKISNTFLFLNVALSVLFFLIKQTLSNPSHSRKSISGKGFLGSILTILDSTFGGGLKLFLPTLIKWSTWDRSWTLTLSLQQSQDPGFAISLWANYFWNMSTAHRNMGLCDSSLNVRGELIWQGMLATQMSKNGSSTCMKSPGINTNLFAYSEYLNLLLSSATILVSISIAITFLALSNNNCVKLPVPGPISKTTSVGLMPDLLTISWRMWELMRMCWPYDLLKIMLVRLTVCCYLIILGQYQKLILLLSWKLLSNTERIYRSHRIKQLRNEQKMKGINNLRECKKMNNFIILLNFSMILIRLIIRNTTCVNYQISDSEILYFLVG